MKKTFFEVFKELKVDDNTLETFKNVFVDRLCSDKSKTKLKVFLSSETNVSEEALYSIEKNMQRQLFANTPVYVIVNFKYLGRQDDDTSATDDAKDKKGKAGEKNAPKKSKINNDSTNSNLIYGRPINDNIKISNLDVLETTMGDVVVCVQVFKTDIRKLSTGKCILSLFITDFTDSIVAKLFLEEDEAKELAGKIKKNTFLKIKANASPDKFEDFELTLRNIKGIEQIEDFRTKRKDEAATKRIELHAHTKMSEMDATLDIGSYIKRAIDWGHEAVAITDSATVYAFPEAAHYDKDIKIIYGMEANLCDDTKPVANLVGDGSYSLMDDFIVFDLETTGLNASREDIIEIGAVHVKNGKVIDFYSSFVNPKKPLSYDIINLTHITDEMLKDAREIKEVMPEFLEFCSDYPLVAHNADFDISVLGASCARLGIPFDKDYTDTVAIARFLLPELNRYRLDNVSKELGLPPFNHHRAVDDARVTADIFNKFVEMLASRGISTLDELNHMDTEGINIYKKLFASHATIFCKNDLGRLNLYRLVSKSHLDYFYTVPRIPKTELIAHREGLLIGSGGEKGELFDALLSGKNERELARIISFYDFLEVMPAENFLHLLDNSRYGLKHISDLENLNRQIVTLGEKYGKPVVATGNAHFLDPEDELYTRIILSEKKSLSRKPEAGMYFKTTEEMLDSFRYLGEDKSWEIVIDNPAKINRMIEKIKPTRPDKCPPVIDKSDEELRKICYDKAHSMYGEELPIEVEERLEKELTSIISNGYAVLYIIAQKLVWKSNEDGYIVGSRGSVGSSLVATMAGISEVNPLPPHYRCPQCHYSDFTSEMVKDAIGKVAGCDMPDKPCPHCNTNMIKDGFDIPFATFLGFEGDKEPDIDLNFSGVYQASAHKYTEVLFGSGQTFKAGTISTLADKKAYAFANGFFEKRGEHHRRCEIERISMGCLDVRVTTGQHAGGIIVLPHGEEINSFVPIQYPANDASKGIITTHFDYHKIDANLLKLDLLGKDDPTQIRQLQDITGIGVDDIPLDDKKVLSLFQCTDALGLSPSELRGIDFGTLGIPEFGTDFAMGILRDTNPQSIMDLVRIAGLSHGTDVWEGNAKKLIEEGKASISTAICTRDDIMGYLISMGLPPKDSFKIMESVRKGKGLTPEWEAMMVEHEVPDWYIWSCKTIKYMFPKAHAAAYVMMAYRIGYYKVYYPLAYYAAYFTVKATAFNYEMMCRGVEVVSHFLDEYEKNGTAGDKDTIRDLRIVYEMYQRGYEFLPMNLYKSDATMFTIEDGKILPPFSSLDGIGDKAAITLCEAAKTPFSSIEDVKNRGKITQTAIDKMVELGILKGLSQSDQLSFFDLFGN